MSPFLLDLRQSLRGLLRSPGFLATATFCLALGIGANLAVISHVDRLVLHPLPFPDSARLAVIEPVDTLTGETGPMTMADFLDVQALNPGFQSLAACTARTRTLTNLGEPARVNVGMVTADFFGALGVRPALGRVVFRAEEEVMPASVGILRHDFWMARFHGDPAVLGRTVVLDGTAVQVVGVLPADFRFFERIRDSQVFTPEATPFAGRNNRGMGTFYAIGRLRQGTSFPQAQSEARVAGARISANTKNAHFGVRVSSLLDQAASNYRQVLMTFQGAVAIVLLITCFNVAGLQLVRDMARRRELAIRQALGAGQGQMGRLFLAESLILAGAGSGLGIVLSYYLQQALGWLMRDLSPLPVEASLYPALIAAAVALALATGFGLALLSWYMARSSQVAEALRAGSRGSQGRGHWRVLKGLVVAEVALSVMLLLGAGLLIHTLMNLRNVHPGFEAAEVLTVNLPLPPQKYSLAVQKAFLRQLEADLKAVPGVKEVGVNDTLPFVKASNTGFVHAGPPAPAGAGGDEGLNVRWHVVSAGYFKAMGIPMVAGQTFSSADARACLVSRRLAASLWPGADPLGRLVYTGSREPFTVAGVVGDTAENDVSKKEAPQFYVSSETHTLFEGPVVVVKVQGNPGRYAAQVKAAIRTLDPDLAQPEPLPMKEAMERNLALQSTASLLFLAFGMTALLLSAVGLYGVLGQIALQRRREIGIRLSLGASRSQVAAGILSGAGSMVGLGLAVGSLFGWGVSRALGQWLYGLSQAGPLIYLGVVALLVPAALMACLLPALRAASVNPAEVLRSE